MAREGRYKEEFTAEELNSDVEVYSMRVQTPGGQEFEVFVPCAGAREPESIDKSCRLIVKYAQIQPGLRALVPPWSLPVSPNRIIPSRERRREVRSSTLHTHLVVTSDKTVYLADEDGTPVNGPSALTGARATVGLWRVVYDYAHMRVDGADYGTAVALLRAANPGMQPRVVRARNVSTSLAGNPFVVVVGDQLSANKLTYDPFNASTLKGVRVLVLVRLMLDARALHVLACATAKGSALHSVALIDCTANVVPVLESVRVLHVNDGLWARGVYLQRATYDELHIHMTSSSYILLGLSATSLALHYPRRLTITAEEVGEPDMAGYPGVWVRKEPGASAPTRHLWLDGSPCGNIPVGITSLDTLRLTNMVPTAVRNALTLRLVRPGDETMGVSSLQSAQRLELGMTPGDRGPTGVTGWDKLIRVQTAVAQSLGTLGILHCMEASFGDGRISRPVVMRATLDECTWPQASRAPASQPEPVAMYAEKLGEPQKPAPSVFEKAPHEPAGAMPQRWTGRLAASQMAAGGPARGN